jgi:hypothetical protein
MVLRRKVPDVHLSAIWVEAMTGPPQRGEGGGRSHAGPAARRDDALPCLDGTVGYEAPSEFASINADCHRKVLGGAAGMDPGLEWGRSRSRLGGPRITAVSHGKKPFPRGG